MNQEVYYYYFKEVFQLDDDYKMKELSTGMKVKYFLSLELAKSPDLLVLDEPTSGLDPIVRDEVLDILRCVAKRKKYFRVILVTYYRRYRKNSR